MRKSLNTLAAFVLLLATAYPLQGLAIMLLWKWFVVAYIGLPTLTLAPAIGMALTFNALKGPSVIPDDLNRKALIALYFHPPLLILVGWIVTLFL